MSKAHPSKSVIFSAPQGWGKTRRSEQLRQRHGCTAVVDDWHADMPITTGALHLSNQHPETIRSVRQIAPNVQLMSAGW